MSRKVVVPNHIIFEDVVQRIGRGERVILKTKGNSMLPFIVGGRDSVELLPIEGELVWGDIVLAQMGAAQMGTQGHYLIHRVVGISEQGITLLGDGNLTPDPVVDREKIIARVVCIIRPHSEVDPRSKGQLRFAKIWAKLLPIRRYLLGVLRRTIYRKHLYKALK